MGRVRIPLLLGLLVVTGCSGMIYSDEDRERLFIEVEAEVVAYRDEAFRDIGEDDIEVSDLCVLRILQTDKTGKVALNVEFTVPAVKDSPWRRKGQRFNLTLPKARFEREDRLDYDEIIEWDAVSDS